MQNVYSCVKHTLLLQRENALLDYSLLLMGKNHRSFVAALAECYPSLPVGLWGFFLVVVNATMVIYDGIPKIKNKNFTPQYDSSSFHFNGMVVGITVEHVLRKKTKFK